MTLRKVSDLLYARTSAATRAAIAATISPIGLAFSAAFNSHWAAVYAPVATLPATMAAFCATQAAVVRATCTPCCTMLRRKSPANMALSAIVSARSAALATLDAVQALTLFQIWTVRATRLRVPVTVFQAIKPPTTAVKTVLFWISEPKKPPSVRQKGDEITSLRKDRTPGITDLDRNDQVSLTLSRTDRMKSTRPESSSTPKKPPSKSPLMARLKKDFTPGTSVPTTQLYREIPVSLISVRAVITGESAASPKRLPSYWPVVTSL